MLQIKILFNLKHFWYPPEALVMLITQPRHDVIKVSENSSNPLFIRDYQENLNNIMIIQKLSFNKLQGR